MSCLKRNSFISDVFKFQLRGSCIELRDNYKYCRTAPHILINSHTRNLKCERVTFAQSRISIRKERSYNSDLFLKTLLVVSWEHPNDVS